MTVQAAIACDVTDWQLEKRTEAGELFEVIEGGAGKATRVTFRREGLAPLDSYAMTLPVVIAIHAGDVARVSASDRS